MAIPTPEAGLVISYAYLWHHEHLAGHEEGRKDRPAVIVLASQSAGGKATDVTVLPITHNAPDNPNWAVEIPLPVKRHLGLDDARSWIIVAEGNDFLWPGYDLRKIPNTDRYDFGFLPPRFFNRVLEAFDELRRVGEARSSSRA
jgi:PemK-like, MazF-like toxin of type II toxin-antitoxin system